MSLDTPQVKQDFEEVAAMKARLFELQEEMDEKGFAKNSVSQYLNALYALLDKEHTIFIRLKLIDTDEARDLISTLDAHEMMDLFHVSDDYDLGEVYRKMKKNLRTIIETTQRNFPK